MRVILGGLILMILTAGSCSKYPPSDGVSVDSELTKRIVKAPESVKIDGKELVLSTELWRDFMPGVGERERSLRAAVSITDKSGGQIPTGMEFKRLYVTQNDTAWVQTISNSERSDKLIIRANTTGGPEWAPDSEATVIAEFNHDDKTYKLRTTGVIRATY